jgi:hypothetical protein
MGFATGVFLIGLAGLTSACATGGSKPSAPEQTLTQVIDGQIAKDDGIPWVLKRPLTWNDFKGDPPSNTGSVAAETAYTLIHGTRCSRSAFEYRVVAAFRPKDSWVRHSMLRTPAESARALRHEQTHFNLTEVHARRLRRYFAELIAPCRTSSGDQAAMAERIGRDEKAAQAQYDSETDHGRNANQQARWDKDVDGQLVALSKYVR